MTTLYKLSTDVTVKWEAQENEQACVYDVYIKN